MTKSRRVMAVIVAALLIAAMILPGLVVKAEAAEGEAGKVTIESKDNKTLQYKPGESQKWTLVITNKTGRDFLSHRQQCICQHLRHKRILHPDDSLLHTAAGLQCE